MAFVLCPECGTPNSDLSMACPKCGFPIGYVTDRTQLVSLDSNPFTDPESFLEELEDLEDAEYEAPEPASLIVESQDLPPALYALLCNSHDIDVRVKAAANVKLPGKLLAFLADDHNVFVREAVASNVSASAETLAKLAEERGHYDEFTLQDSSHVRTAVALNPSASVETLDKLACDESVHVRKAIATRRDASQGALMRLARDGNETYTSYDISEWSAFECARMTRPKCGTVTIKELVARNPSAGPEVLRFLARDEDDAIRRAVASHPSADEDTLSLLAQDESWNVRLQVAGNPSASEANLCQIAMDLGEHRHQPADHLYHPGVERDAPIAFAIAQNPSSTLAVFQLCRGLLGDSLAHHIGMNPSLGAGTLRRLAEDEDARFRAVAGGHSLTDWDVLLRLSRDPDEDVRRAVASNGSAPSVVAEIIARDPSPEVRLAFASSESPFLELLLEDDDPRVLERLAPNPCANPTVLGALASHDDSGLRRAVAGNPSCSVYVLEKLSTDMDEAVRCAVARNGSTSPGAVERLSRDECRDVRVAVASRDDTSILSVYERLASEGDWEICEALSNNSHVPEDARERMRDEYERKKPHNHDNDFYVPDPADNPLYGWHFDEDNGWLDFYPED